MTLMEGVLKKLFSAIEQMSIDGDGPIWDMTSRHPLDVYIDAVSIALMKLLELRGMSRAGQDTNFCAATDEGACGVVVRARLFGRHVQLLIRTEGKNGSREEVPATILYPDYNADHLLYWQHVSCTYED